MPLLHPPHNTWLNFPRPTHHLQSCSLMRTHVHLRSRCVKGNAPATDHSPSYINDIVNDTQSVLKLFADDTSMFLALNNWNI